MPGKLCFKCGESKPRTEFYRHPMMGDGLLGKCKECAKRDVRANYNKDIEASRRRERARNRTVTWSGASPEAHRKWVEKNPEKRRAQLRLIRAVRAGQVERLPCFVCGATKVHGHHEDYSLPLTVMWMCPRHHGLWHRMKRERERVYGKS